MKHSQLEDVLYYSNQVVNIVKEVSIAGAALAAGYALCQLARLLGAYADLLSFIGV